MVAPASFDCICPPPLFQSLLFPPLTLSPLSPCPLPLPSYCLFLPPQPGALAPPRRPSLSLICLQRDGRSARVCVIWLSLGQGRYAAACQPVKSVVGKTRPFVSWATRFRRGSEGLPLVKFDAAAAAPCICPPCHHPFVPLLYFCLFPILDVKHEHNRKCISKCWAGQELICI